MQNAATSTGLNARLSVSHRLARRLKDWFGKIGHGAQADLVTFSKNRPGGTRISAQNLSYFLHGHRVNPIGLDDLDDIAAFFNVSISDLFDEKERDLIGDEHRWLLAYRAMPRVTQEQCLAIAELAAGSPSFVRFRDRPVPVTGAPPKGRTARIAATASLAQRTAEAAKLRAMADEIDPVAP